MKRFLLTAFFAASLLPARAQGVVTGPAFVRDSLDAYVRRGMKAWNIPGLALAIVKDGQVLVSKGYGTREVGQDAPVDENTLFYIASNTKLFTGTAVANLVDQKKLALDDKVTQYLPDFALYEPTSTQLVSVRDLLSHRLGTKTFQGDFTFWNSDLPRAEIVRRMRLLKPTNPFRQDYGYCNSAFVAAGEVVGKVSGQPWEDYVSSTLLQPLGMANTVMLTRGIENRPNLARPYTTTLGPLQLLPYDQIDALGPAASMVSCVKDLSQWLRFQLDSGKVAGRRVLPWSVLQRTRDANILTRSRRNPRFPMHFQAYGLGVYTADYNGRQLYWHTGGADGFVSGVCFVPEAGLGIAILTNQDNQSFFEALRYQLLDAYLEVPYQDRSRLFLTPTRAGEAEEAQSRAALAARVTKKNKLPRAQKAYAGTYHHELMGDITVAPDGKRDLKITFPHQHGLTARLEYMDGEDWRLSYSNPTYGQFVAPFRVAGEQVTGLKVKVNDFLEYDPYEFVRR